MTALTPREQQVARLVAEGLASCEIAYRLRRSEQTIKNQLTMIYRKLELDGPHNKRAALVRWVWEHDGEEER